MFHCSESQISRNAFLKRTSCYYITSRDTLLVTRRNISSSPWSFKAWTIVEEKRKKKKRKEKKRMHEFESLPSKTRPKFTLLTTFSTKRERERFTLPAISSPFCFLRGRKTGREVRERNRQRETKEGGEGGGGRKDARIFSPPSSSPFPCFSSFLCKQARAYFRSHFRGSLPPSPLHLFLRSLEPSTAIPQARRVGSRVAGWPPKEKGTGVNGVVS